MPATFISRSAVTRAAAQRGRLAHLALVTVSLLAAAILGACSREVNAASLAGDTGKVRNVAPLPAELLGAWVHGSADPASVADAHATTWVSDAAGTSIRFEFGPNGTYKQSILVTASALPCRTQLLVHNEGTAVLDGNTFRVYPTRGTVRSRDTCDASRNFDREDDVAIKQGDLYGWNLILHDDGETYLHVGAKGDMTRAADFRRS